MAVRPKSGRATDAKPLGYTLVPGAKRRYHHCSISEKTPASSDQICSVLDVSPHTEGEDDFVLLPVGEFKGDLDCGTGVQGSPTLPESRARVREVGQQAKVQVLIPMG